MFEREKLFPDEDLETTSINGKRFYVTPKGNFPSVTTVLSIKENKELEDWRKAVGAEEANRITEEALRRGTKFHSLLEDFLNNKEVNPNWILKSHFLQVKDFLQNNIQKVYGNEIPLYSERIKVAGRCDSVVKMHEKMFLLDFKTSKKYKESSQIDSYYMQCSAYCFMIKELYNIDIQDFCVIISNLDENFPNYFYGKRDDHIKKFVKLRLKFKEKENA